MLIEFLETIWRLLEISSFWLLFSFILCGLLHVFLRPEVLQKSLGNKKLSSLVKATISGMLLPICSCGVIPLALSLYYSGAYLGPTLAFMTATPIINPAAIILAYALMGPQIATIYLIAGFTIPFICGLLANIWGGKETKSPLTAELEKRQAEMAVTPKPIIIEEERPKTPLKSKLASGLHWGFQSLGLEVSRFAFLGMVLAAILLLLVPVSFIQTYLSNPGMISLLGAVIIGAVMYVCALGHIPFIAALISSGAAPGVAVTFLLTGVATNLPEIISIGKLIGKRTIMIYTGSILILGLIFGYLTNLFLVNFTPIFDVSGSQTQIALANTLSFAVPKWLETISAFIILVMGVYGWFNASKKWLFEKTSKFKAAKTKKVLL